MDWTSGLNIEFPIYNEDGTSFNGLVLRKATVDTVVMSLGDKITGDVYYKDNSLAFTMHEYVVYKDVKYTIVNPPTVVREGLVRDNSELKGMTKYSFEFYHPMYLLNNLPFADVAVSSDETRYLSENKTFSWIGKPDDFIAKLNKNLEGTEWVVVKSDRFPKDKANTLSQVLQFDKNTIGDAMKKAYEEWDIPYVIDSVSETEQYYGQGKRFKVVFGLPSNEIYETDVDRQTGTPFVFKMGQGVGLKNNSRTPRNNKIVTRLSGYGSERNIPYGYPQIVWTGDQSWTDTKNNPNDPTSYPLYKGIVGGRYVKLIKHPFTRTHLMPSVYRDSVNKKVNPFAQGYNPNIELVDYYDAKGDEYPNKINEASPSYEIHEFDTYPQMNDGSANISIVNAVPLDKDLNPVSDWDDSMDDEGNYIQSYFQITLPRLSFDIYACAAITEEMKVNMRSGACIGCTFDVQVDWEDYKNNFYDSNGDFAPDGTQRDTNKYPKSNEGSIVVVVKKDNTTFGTLMPNIYQNPKSGDEFVVLGISLPNEYLESAETKLDEEMKSYMLENNVYYYDYPLKFDEYFLATHTNILSQVKTNNIVHFDFSGNLLQLFVKQITIKYGNAPLPQYDITLSDNIEVVLNQIGKVADDVEHLGSLISMLRQTKQDDSYSLGLAQKLSKVEDDTARGLITFLKGLVSRGDVMVNGLLTAYNAIMNTIKSSNYTGDGVADSGWLLTNDYAGSSRLVVDYLYARKKAVFESLEIKELQFTSGDLAQSLASATIERTDYLQVDEQGEETILGYSDRKIPWTLKGFLMRLSSRKPYALARNKKIRINLKPEDLQNVNRVRCYFLAKDENKKIFNLWKVNDLARCQTFNIDNIDRETYAGETHKAGNVYWWRLVKKISTETVTVDGKEYHYFDVAYGFDEEQEANRTSIRTSWCDILSDLPAAGDKVVQFGNTENPARMNIIVSEVNGEGNADAPAIKSYRGVHTFNTDDCWWGGESCRKMMLSPSSGVEFYAPTFKFITEYGIERTQVERGAWLSIPFEEDTEHQTFPDYSDDIIDEDGNFVSRSNGSPKNYVRKCRYYDRAEHKGSTWLCTIAESHYWRKYNNGVWSKITEAQYQALPQEEKDKCEEVRNYTTDEPSKASNDWTVSAEKGDKGTSVREVKPYYAKQSPESYNGNPPQDGWEESIAALGTIAEGWYVWTKNVISFTDNVESTTTYTVSKWGIDGDGIENIETKFYESANLLTQAQLEGIGESDWKEYNQLALTKGDYIYTRTKITYDKGGTPTISYQVNRIGQDGVGYVATEEYYVLGNSQTDVPTGHPYTGNQPYKKYTAAEWQQIEITGGWSESRPTYQGDANKYVWNFEVSFDTDGNAMVTRPMCIGNYAKGIVSIVETYAISAYAVAPQAGSYPSDITTWTDEAHDCAPTDEKPYQWNKTVTSYSDGTSDTFYHVSAVKGTRGRGITNTNIYYKADTTTPATPSGAPAQSGWSDNGNDLITDANANKHLYESTCTTYSDGTYSWTTPIDDGLIKDMAEMSEEFALSDSGTVAPTTGWSTSVTPTAGKWVWSRTVLTFKNGNKKYVNTQCVGYCGIDGQNGQKGDKGDKGEQGEGGYGLTLTPQALIFEEKLNGSTPYIDYSNNAVSSVVYKGDTPLTPTITKVTTASSYSGCVLSNITISGSTITMNNGSITSDVTSGYFTVNIEADNGRYERNVRINFYVNRLGTWRVSIENGISTEVGRQISYGIQEGGVIKTAYDAEIEKSAKGLTQQFTEQISKAGDYNINLFGFHKGANFSQFATIPFIQGYGLVVTSNNGGRRQGRVSNLGFENVGGYFVVTFMAKTNADFTSYPSQQYAKVRVDLCDVEPIHNIGSIGDNINIAVNNNWQSYEYHFFLPEGISYMSPDSYNGFIDFEEANEYGITPIITNQGAYIYIRHLKIERGQTATDFCEADEDVAYLGHGNVAKNLDFRPYRTEDAENQTVDGRSGVYRIRVPYLTNTYPWGDTTNPFRDYLVKSDFFNLEAGKCYTLSFWAKSSVNGFIITQHLYKGNYSIINAVGVDLYVDPSNGTIQESIMSDGQTQIKLSTIWTQYFVYFYVANNVPLASVIPLRVLKSYNNSSARNLAYIYMSDIELQEGYVTPTDYFASFINQNARRISLVQQSGTKLSGIDIQNGVVNLMGDRVTFSNSTGTVSGNVWIDPDDGTIHAVNGDFRGKITATSGTIGGFTIDPNRLYNSNWNAGIDIAYDGKNVKIGKNAQGVMATEDAIIRAENTKAKSLLTDTYNTALYLNASGARYNYAFYGNGNGVLNGFVQGYKVRVLTLIGAATYLNLNDGQVQAIASVGIDSDKIIYLPTLENCRNTLGISVNDNIANFSCCITIINQSAIQDTIYNRDNVYVRGGSQDYTDEITNLTTRPVVLAQGNPKSLNITNCTTCYVVITYINKRFIANYITTTW